MLLLFCCLLASHPTWLTEVSERPFLHTVSIILVKVSDDCVLPVGAGLLGVLLVNLFSLDISRVCVLSTLICSLLLRGMEAGSQNPTALVAIPS